MTLKRYYWDRNVECCRTCMFIDEYSLNIRADGEVPHGYDGTAECCMYIEEEPESNTNRHFISPQWKACPKYKKCTERQSDYLDIFDEEKCEIIPNPNDISKINKED